MDRRPAARNNTASPERASSKRRFTRREAAARFILAEANSIDLRIGTDGCDLIIAPPRGMPSASYESFRQGILAYADEIIDIVMEGRA